MWQFLLRFCISTGTPRAWHEALVQPLASRGPGSLELTDSIEISHHVLYARICQIIGIVANMSLSCASQEIKGSPVKRVRAKSPAGPSNQSNCAPWGPKKAFLRTQSYVRLQVCRGPCMDQMSVCPDSLYLHVKSTSHNSHWNLLGSWETRQQQHTLLR